MLTLSDDYKSVLEHGLRLADLPMEEGGWAEYFNESEGLDITDDRLRSQTALMLENEKKWMFEAVGGGRKGADGRRRIDEATVTGAVSGFTDYLFPIVRASFPNNVLHQIASVQATPRPHATILHWNWIFGSNKGTYTQGQRLADSNRGRTDGGHTYTSELIDREVLTTGDGDASPPDGTLAYHDGGGVRAGTVAITGELTAGGTETVRDDGNGTFLGGSGGNAGGATIDYVTGVVSGLTFSGNITNGSDVTATYRWDSEGSDSLPEINVQLISSTTEVERRALRLLHSVEAQQDLMAELGEDLHQRLIEGASNEINYETARQVIAEMWSVAPEIATFPIRPNANAGYNQQDHFRDLAYQLNIASSTINNRTQKGYGNWIIADDAASTLISSLPSTMFESAPVPRNAAGVHYLGRLQGQYDVYKDIFLGQRPGARDGGNMLMGYKGSDFFDAGYVWAPYQLLYTTEPLTTANFLTQRGMASRYATKMVNPDFYVRISLFDPTKS